MLRLSGQIRVLFLTLLLSLSLALPAFAGYTVNSGTLQPCTYLFALVLHVSGVTPVTNAVDQWYSAYRLYLEKSGSAAAKQHLADAEAKSWGSSCPQTLVSGLISDVSGWLDACSVEQLGNSSFFFSPMASPAPVEWVTAAEPFSVQTTPYSLLGADQNPIVTSGSYDYLYSLMYQSGNYIYRENLYVPKGTELFAGYYGQYPYQDKIAIQFYQKDTSSAGYSACPVYKISEWYDANTHARVSGNGAVYHGEISWTSMGSKWLSSLPFPVIRYEAQAGDYAKGKNCVLVKRGFYSWMTGGRMPKIRTHVWQWESASALSLPASASAGESILSRIRSVAYSKYNQLRATLESEAGLTIRWVPWTYTVNHFYDGTLLETTTGSVQPDENQVKEVPLLEKEGYRLSQSPYDPQLPASIDPDNNTLSVFYESWECPYTVNYYYDDVLGERVSLSVPSYHPVVSTVAPKEKHGYRLSQSPYDPQLPASIDPDNNTLSVFYESWEYPYTINYYYDDVLRESVSLSVPSYENTVSEVPLPSSLLYELRDPPYEPELPMTIDGEHAVISVYSASPFSESVSSGFNSMAGSLGRFLMAAMPYALGVAGLTLLVFFALRYYRRLVKKS